MLEPFETIIDYTNKRVVLIRLDSVGRRLTEVPAYTSRWTAPLVAVPTPGGTRGSHWLGIAVRADLTLDTLNAANNVGVLGLDTGMPENNAWRGMLGYPFLSSLGVFGLNQRTHQFILYR